ncbi:hypothetical protein [Nocardioides mangrovi]|uniref:Uncharacterized protein n=1 Tax=Nocardioides mangrovi TaxID=2874580 RepID=A0ABS7UJE6_9ACTN|nr:hypothetical protein [Nocardioides mangrovi]MBZ5741154.1 hypothetical protein [Nocardioides mangrovi]
MGGEPRAGTTRLPRAVWIDSTGMWNHNAGLPPSVGLLLEWRRGADPRGQPAWEGLVIWANSHREGTWSSGCTWIRAACIRPMAASDWRA